MRGGGGGVSEDVGGEGNKPSRGVRTPELSLPGSSDKRVGVLHGLEGKEGERICREEEEKTKNAERYSLRGLEGFASSAGKKSRRASPGESNEEEEEGEEAPIRVVLTSAATGQGIAEVWRIICDACSARGAILPGYSNEGGNQMRADTEETEEEDKQSRRGRGGGRDVSFAGTEEEQDEREGERDGDKRAEGTSKEKPEKNDDDYEDPFWGFGL